MKLNPPVTIEQLPIPEEAQPTRLWPGQMIEMALHIGAYATLRLVDRLGGQTIPVAKDPRRNRMAAVIGEDKAAIMSRIYGGELLAIPLGKAALREARRGPVLASIRARRLTINEAVPILRMKRGTISRLINQSDEGTTSRASLLLPAAPRDARQLDMFADD